MIVLRFNKLKKVRGKSPNELRGRAAQYLAALSERWGLSSHARLPSDRQLIRALNGETSGQIRSTENLLSRFKTSRVPRFFAAFECPEETVAEFRRRWPQKEEEAIARARRIVAGRFDLLGHRDLNFGDPPDWHLEPSSGKRAPRVHWSKIDYLDASVAGDKKITWELNRHQYFAVLGRAYWLTRDEIFAQTFVKHLTSWMEANPPKIGINWASSLEVAFRAISWLWALHFFKDSPSLTPDLFARTLKYLYLHGRHIETYLSTYFSPNTHLTGEALGLFYLGTLLPEFSCAARWKAKGEAILMRELDRHVRPDGVYFEQSSYYHRYTTDFYTHFLLLKKRNGEKVPAILEEKLTALLDHLMAITRPDGTTPLFGDDDGGRLLILDQRAPDDFRSALSNGAAIFGRGDYKFVAGEAAEETLWLLGPEGLRAVDRLEPHAPEGTSRAFTSGGYYVLRDGWTQDANYMLIDCGPHGVLNCGHAHADVLAFDLAARGRTLLVDPGTYTYTGSDLERRRFRSSAMHNALTIDGLSSSEPDGPFTWKSIARARAIEWISDQRFDLFEGEHDGYESVGAQHRRSVFFLKGDYWIMRDLVSAAGDHLCALHFHFVPDASPTVEREGDAFVIRESARGRAGIEIFIFGAEGELRCEDSWVSRCYGARERAKTVRFEARIRDGVELVTLLIPQTEERSIVREVECHGGRAFEIVSDAKRDVVLIGEAERLKVSTNGRRMETDCRWAWLRFVGEELAEVVLVAGSELTVDGDRRFSVEDRFYTSDFRRSSAGKGIPSQLVAE
ncbi:heparinase II/III family protein [Pyrinomonas methylaliphatogenes]|uniref:Heparinase II/III-like protein n=1 Tax=Pyrinomonas methylaliphatogenes TaxID=454194 RepID=A0A0B6X1K5_9BACT|nr:alginate lyase family protein [Pyrinomonas methylaliphatogenes]CDM66250.1 Heparinase II/III-like protein [Pyrinomonas methylaliphatogenes]